MDKNIMYLHIEEIFLSSFIESIPNPLYYKDSSHVYRQCNGSFLKFLGRQKEEIVNMTDHDIFEKTMADIYRAEDEKLFEKKDMVIYENRLMHSDKTYHDVIFFNAPIYDMNNGLIGMIGLITDITEMKQKEKALAESNNRKDKMLKIIAHDLRAPLGSFNNLIDFVLEKYVDFSKEELFEILKDIKKATASIYDLLENLFYWGRIQFIGKEINIEPVDAIDLNEIIDKNEYLLKDILLKKNIVLKTTIDESILLKADRATLDIIIRNCIMNAVKFSHKNSVVEITGARNDGRAEISITDHGVGIPEENLEILKSENNRISTAGTDNEKGSGLGLNLCREILRVNNGSMEIESKVGEGSTFRLIFEEMHGR